VAGDIHTGFVDAEMTPWAEEEADEASLHAALAAAALAPRPRRAAAAGAGVESMPSPWLTVGPWEIGGGRGE
jgi:hypothetical protein